MAMTIPPTEVATLVVEAPRIPPLAGESVFSSREISLQELSTTPRLDAALKSVPGVSLFRRTGSDGANPTIQGISLRSIAPSGAGRALVTLDGVPVNDPFGGWVIWSSLLPEGLEGVKIVRGAGAGAYGAGALTGVVALSGRRVSDGEVLASATGGSLGFKRLSVLAGGGGLTIVGGLESSDGYTPVRGSAAGSVDVPAKFNGANLSGQVQGSVGAVRIAVHLGGYEERRGSGLLGANSDAKGADVALTLAEPEVQGGWRIQAWARRSDLSNTSVAVGTGRATATPASDQYSTPALGYGVNAALQGRGEVWSWEAGADLRLATGRAFERFRYQNGVFTRGRVSGGETAIGGAYLDLSRKSGPLLLTGGVRFDQWRQSGAVRLERDLSTGAVTLDSPSRGKSGTTPTGRVGAKWLLGEGTWLRAAAYSGFRPPTLNELHRPFRVGNDVTEANPSLTPERLFGGEAGIGGDRAETWSLAVFYNEIKDPVTNVTVGTGPKTFPIAGFIPTGGALRMRQNAGRIDAAGIEAEVGRTFGDMTVDWSGAYTQARVDGGGAAPQLTGKWPAQAPRLTLTTAMIWRATPKLTLGLNARYESARFEDDLNTRKLPASTGVDLRADWRFGDRTSVYVAVENTADAKIVVGQTGDGVSSFSAPRSLRFGISYR